MKSANLDRVCALPSTLTELFACVMQKGQLSLTDRYGLMAVLLDNSISEEEKDIINRVLYAVRRGRLKVVNEL
jgi:hypothetical protein